MRKRIAICLIACFVLTALGGCAKKVFDLSAHELRAQINENLKSLGYDYTLPEFEERKIIRSKNGKDDGESRQVYFEAGFNGATIQIANYYMNGSKATLVFSYPQNASDAEIDAALHNFIDLSTAVIKTIDPQADGKALLNEMEMASLETGTRNAYSNRCAYELETSGFNKTLFITLK